ncbi:MFS transporter [Cohaesibacter haloalkalitolerans]|uniref:MFS transporter n=1 Tax=Cohaesibacter haloalkalitolerans TaxID=1162980 RepID=UPI000E648096|nr:MFS transporter [Cohaesibacter haloalkalitolerans]
MNKAVPANQNSVASSVSGAVLSMSLCVAMLIASEFMPASLLTPIADGLAVTEGQAGQAISISGLFAVVASLLTTTLAGNLNRKWILIAMTAIMFVSLVAIALAPDFPVLIFARALLGITIGGFWSLGTSVIMRLVPAERVSSALAVMYAGQAMAAAFAAPVGSYLGAIIGWRGVFWLLAPIVAIDLIWQIATLPSMPAGARMSPATFVRILGRRHFLNGIVAAIVAYIGAFSMFTYLRPFLENTVQVDVQTLSLLFLVLGCCGFLGTWLGGRFSGKHVIRLLQIQPLVMSLSSVGLIIFDQSILAVGLLLAIWGTANTMMSISWMAWLAQTMEDQPEAAGSLIVAAIQSAIMLGAMIGGTLFDHFGIGVTFCGSAAISLVALFLIGSGRRLTG